MFECIKYKIIEIHNHLIILIIKERRENLRRIIGFEKEEDHLISELDYENSNNIEPNCFACFGCYTIKRCFGLEPIWERLRCPNKCLLA